MKKFEELLSFSLTAALMNDNKPKSTEKSESKAAEKLEMEPKQSEQPTKSTGKGAAIPMPWISNTNMDDYHNNTNTSPTPSTTNADKINDGDGVKAPKRGRPNSKKKSAPLTEEMSSPPQKKPLKPPTEVKKEVEAEKHTIFESPSAMPYNNYPNYAGYSFPLPHAYYGHPSCSTMLSASDLPPSPTEMPATMMLSPYNFGWVGPPPMPVATSTPLNPAFVCSTSSQQIDSSMMDVKKEASGEDLTEEMWDPTAVGNTNMDLSNSWASNSIEDQSNDKNGPTSSGEISTAGPKVPLLTPMQKMPITPKQQFGTPHPMFYPTQQDQVQTIIIKDIKEEISEDAKDGISIYRNCLVCGDNNKKCGKYTALQVCDSCKQFFKRVVESDADKKATFQCSQMSENCLINKETRNSCEYCRFQACLKAGMDRQKTVELKAKREPEDAKDGNGIYRNCLVCGDNNYKCGKFTGTGLQVCDACRQFFKRVVKSGSDKKDTFQCSQGPGNCLISKQTRNSCEFCRFQACLKAGMDPHKRVELNAKREEQQGSGNDN